MDDRRSRLPSLSETPEDEEFRQLTNVAVEAIVKHPEISFDEKVAVWFGDDVFRKYTVNFTMTIIHVNNYLNNTFHRHYYIDF